MGLFSTFGLTFSATGYAGVIKGLALFPLLLPAAHFAAYTFVTSPVSDSVLDALPVPVAKVPALVAFLLVALAAGSGLVAIVAINLLGTRASPEPAAVAPRASLPFAPRAFVPLAPSR